MISVNDLRTGLTIEVDGEIYSVVEFLHVKPGKGAAFVRTKLKNLRSGNTCLLYTSYQNKWDTSSGRTRLRPRDCLLYTSRCV